MKNILIPLLAWLLTVWATPAGDRYQFQFKGFASTTDDLGRIVSFPINNRTILQDFANAHGLTNISPYGLAYHVGASEMGDTIEVIQRHDGATVYTLFGFYFGEDFGRMALNSANGRQSRRLEYVYTDQNSHSLGSALLTNRYFFDAQGTLTNTVVLGQMQYLVLGNATHTNVLVCSGNFRTVRPWKFGP